MSRRIVASVVSAVFLTFFLQGTILAGIPIKGSNGRVIEFEGVKQATPEGMVLMMGGKEIFVNWDRFDIQAMKTDNANLHQAYKEATMGNRMVDLKLGVYENEITEQEFLEGLSKELSQALSYPLPVLSDFFEHKDDDAQFLSTSYSEDKNAAKRSKRFVSSFEKLIEEFFRIQSPELEKRTITWNYYGSSPLVIVKEASVTGKENVQLKHIQILEYFSNPNNSSRAKAAKYLNMNKDSLKAFVAVLEKQRSIADTQLPSSLRKKSTYVYALTALEKHFNGFSQSSTINVKLADDCKDLLRMISK